MGVREAFIQLISSLEKKDGESHEVQRRQTGMCPCWHGEGAQQSIGNLPMDTCKYYFPPRGAYKGRVSSILLIINNGRTVKCLLKYPVSFSASLCAEQGEIVSTCEKGKYETGREIRWRSGAFPSSWFFEGFFGLYIIMIQFPVTRCSLGLAGHFCTQDESRPGEKVEGKVV